MGMFVHILSGRCMYIRNIMNVLYRSKIRRATVSQRNNCAVPVVMILSLTSQCNLNCAGCYAKRFNANDDVFDFNKVYSIIEQAEDLGIYSYILVGGEPLLFDELVKVKL